MTPSAVKFTPWPKIPRYRGSGGLVVTEKIDGTNAQIAIRAENDYDRPFEANYDTPIAVDGKACYIRAGSRNRWLPNHESKFDNYWFGKWVGEHATELATLGEGEHFGEWWGQGIGRNYGMVERAFSLFNVSRWNPKNPNRPVCCAVVPILAENAMWEEIPGILEQLKKNGSSAYPYMNPEGIIIFHRASQQMFKMTTENDELPKSIAVAA